MRYPGGACALGGVSLSVAEGERVGLLGESGSGKSTLGLAVLGLIDPSARVSGEVRFRGRRMSAVFQEPAQALNPVLRIGRQMAEVLRAHRSAETVESALSVGGFDDVGRVARSYAHQLSGGECQRVSIALALACRPDLLIADEPTASLDSIAQVRILDLLAREHRGAMLFVSHDPAVLYRMTDRIVVLRQGAVVEQGLEDPYAQGVLAACRSMGGGE